MSKLPQIVQIFKNIGKDSMPVCIVQNAYRTDETCVQGTMNSIISVVQEQGVKNPAVIIIGEVVRYGSAYLKEALIHQTNNQKAS